MHRVCFIDLGTNSFHAIIVDFDLAGGFEVIDKLKEVVGLAEAGLAARRLTRDGVGRALVALERIQVLARRREAKEIVAYATSAIREADNGRELCRHVRDELGLEIEPISGEREARLIYRGARRAVDLQELSLLVDIGGGSTEFSIADSSRVEMAMSLPLGAGRLTERYVTTDPISVSELEHLRDAIAAAVKPVVERCLELGVHKIVGSSSTMEQLLECALERAGKKGSPAQHHLASLDVRDAITSLVETNVEAREQEYGIDEHRKHQIVAGAVLLDVLLESLPVQELLFSPAALREGMVDEYAECRLGLENEVVGSDDIMVRRALELVERHCDDRQHALQVASLATMIYDGLASIAGADERERRMLRAAALAHDVGRSISAKRHHKHSRYIIANAQWTGVTPREVALIANIARYHRRALPKKKHRHFAKLESDDRDLVRRLGAVLRMAEALDRSHVSNTTEVSVNEKLGVIRLVITTEGSPDLELDAARDAAFALEDAYQREVAVHAVWQRGASTRRLAGDD